MRDLSGFEMDEAALVKKPKPIGWFAAGLIGIGALGFIAAYYLPLDEAHSTLLEKHEALAKKSNELDQTLKSKTQTLSGTEQRRDALEVFIKSGQEAEAKLKSQLEMAQATAERQLAPYTNGKLARVELKPDALVIAFTERASFSPHSDRLVPQLGGQICKATASLSQSTQFQVTVEASVPEDEKDAWKLASGRAAAAAGLLVDRCQVKLENISAQARLVKAGASTDALTLHVEPSSPVFLRASQAPSN